MVLAWIFLFSIETQTITISYLIHVTPITSTRIRFTKSVSLSQDGDEGWHVSIGTQPLSLPGDERYTE